MTTNTPTETPDPLAIIAKCMANTPGDHPEAEKLHAQARKLAESPWRDDQAKGEIERTKLDRDRLKNGVLTCLKYPRGSEAQIRCLEEVGQDAEATPSENWPLVVTKEGHDAKVAELTAQIERLTRERDEANARLGECQFSLTGSRNANRVNCTALIGVTHELDTVRADAEKAREEIARLRTDVADLNAYRAKAMELLESLRAELTAARDKAAEGLASVKQKAQDESNKLRVQLTAARENVNELRQSYDMVSTQLTAARGELNEVKTNYLNDSNSLVDKLTAARGDFATLLADANRSREIIYAMSKVLDPEAGEHNIDVAHRRMKELAAANEAREKAELELSQLQNIQAWRTLRNERDSLAADLERVKGELTFHSHRCEEHHNVGQSGMPQGPCDCLICASYYKELNDLWDKLAESNTLASLTSTLVEQIENERNEALATVERMRGAIKSVTGKEAERLALDMDHRNRGHSKWWKAVESARVTVAEKPSDALRALKLEIGEAAWKEAIRCQFSDLLPAAIREERINKIWLASETRNRLTEGAK